MILLRFTLWILSNAAALWLASALIPNFAFSGNAGDWILAGVVLGLGNLIVKPILKLFAGPFIILTFGVGLIVIQGLILWLTGIVLAVTSNAVLFIDFPWGYVWGSIVVGIAGMAFGGLRKSMTAPSGRENDETGRDEQLQQSISRLREDIEELHHHHRQKQRRPHAAPNDDDKNSDEEDADETWDDDEDEDDDDDNEDR